MILSDTNITQRNETGQKVKSGFQYSAHVVFLVISPLYSQTNSPLIGILYEPWW